MRFGPGGPSFLPGPFLLSLFLSSPRHTSAFWPRSFVPACRQNVSTGLAEIGRLLFLAGLLPCFFHPRSAAQHPKPGDLGDLSDLYQIRAASQFALYRVGGHTALVPTPPFGD